MYVKVLGVYQDDLLTEVIQEVHRDDIDEAIDYIKEHPNNNVMWILKPCG
jgi:hypothetical protein